MNGFGGDGEGVKGSCTQIRPWLGGLGLFLVNVKSLGFCVAFEVWGFGLGWWLEQK